MSAEKAGQWSKDLLPHCDVNGCGVLADWAYIGEGGDLYLCKFHASSEPVEGWMWIGE